jgi:glucose-1-phosphate thymidylyltransferase
MKGVLLCGGNGTRLRPLTNFINKNLLPVGRQPMLLHPIQKLKEAGVTEILITCGSEHMGNIIDLCRSGKSLGIDITYKVQEEALGIAHAIALAENFVGKDHFCVILGDNVFDQNLFSAISSHQLGNAGIFVKSVDDPSRFGVVKYNESGDPVKLVEKPNDFISNDAVIGVYIYPPDAFDHIRSLQPSARGEYEVTDLNNIYMEQGRMKVHRIDGEWIDCGTFDSLHKANNWAFKKP